MCFVVVFCSCFVFIWVVFDRCTFGGPTYGAIIAIVGIAAVIMVVLLYIKVSIAALQIVVV